MWYRRKAVLINDTIGYGETLRYNQTTLHCKIISFSQDYNYKFCFKQILYRPKSKQGSLIVAKLQVEVPFQIYDPT